METQASIFDGRTDEEVVELLKQALDRLNAKEARQKAARDKQKPLPSTQVYTGDHVRVVLYGSGSVRAYWKLPGTAHESTNDNFVIKREESEQQLVISVASALDRAVGKAIEKGAFGSYEHVATCRPAISLIVQELVRGLA